MAVTTDLLLKALIFDTPSCARRRLISSSISRTLHRAYDIGSHLNFIQTQLTTTAMSCLHNCEQETKLLQLSSIGSA